MTERIVPMFRTVVALIGLSLLAGCGRGEIGERLPDDPDQLTLYSIDPSGKERKPGAGQDKGELLYGYPVLGKVAVADPERRRAVTAAIKTAIRDKSVIQMKCFDPRHAVRVVKGSETIDLVICFHCHNYDGFRNDEPATKNGTPSISSSAQPLLDQLLRDAGVPLAAPAKN